MKKYYFVGIVQKSNRKIMERGKSYTLSKVAGLDLFH